MGIWRFGSALWLNCAGNGLTGHVGRAIPMWITGRMQCEFFLEAGVGWWEK